MGREGCSWRVEATHQSLAEQSGVRVPCGTGPQFPPRAAHALCKRPRPRLRQAPPPPGPDSGSCSARGGGGEKPQLQLRLEALSLAWAHPGTQSPSPRSRRFPGPASAQWARPWQSPPPAPRRIWPLRSPPVAEQPLTRPPARPPALAAAAPGSTQVSAAEGAGGEGGGGRTRGVVRPRPSRPLCGGASWPRRLAAGTAPAEPAVSRRVSNGTVPQLA